MQQYPTLTWERDQQRYQSGTALPILKVTRSMHILPSIDQERLRHPSAMYEPMVCVGGAPGPIRASLHAAQLSALRRADSGLRLPFESHAGGHAVGNQLSAQLCYVAGRLDLRQHVSQQQQQSSVSLSDARRVSCGRVSRGALEYHDGQRDGWSEQHDFMGERFTAAIR